MLPVLAPGTEYKKEYNFVWYLNALTDVTNKVEFAKIHPEIAEAYSVLFQPLYTAYISQLAETVDLPEDALETEDYDVGNVTYSVPKRMKMDDISVTYLDDSINSVYNYHKAWMNLCRAGDTFSMLPLRNLAVQGVFITTDNSFTAEEYMALKAQYIIEEGANKVSRATKSATISNTFSESTNLLANVKPTGIYTYPLLFPVRIKRSSANKSGQGLAKVTVTYKRLPKVKKPKALSDPWGADKPKPTETSE